MAEYSRAKSQGGLGYGYAVCPDGERGKRAVVEHEADIIRRVFKEFADGKSPEAIAKDLNKVAIPGPVGRPWSNTTIRGQAARGTGLLNNEMYRGVLVWNRCSYVKDPHSGKKVARPNPPEKYEVAKVPHLQIVDDALWIRVKARQEMIRQRLATQRPRACAPDNKLNAAHRPRFLLSGLLQCGCCGGGYTIVAKDRYGCATRRQKGLCGNTRTITRGQLEARVLGGLKDRLLAPDLVKEFVQEFNAEIERNRAAANARFVRHARNLADIDRKIASMIKAIEDGMYHPSMKERMAQLEADRAALACDAAPTEVSRVDVLVHPNLPELYRRKVSELEQLLEAGPEHYEAKDLIRSMIDRVVLMPRKTAGGLDATLYGELGAILAVCASAANNGGLPSKRGSQLSVVAGARNHLDLQLKDLLSAVLS